MSKTTVNSSQRISQSSNNQSNELSLSKIIDTVRKPVLHFCQDIIFGPIQFKLIASFTIIVIGSFLKTFSLVPDTYFSLKTNIFNRYFAKLGWAWTIGLLGPFIYLTLMTTRKPYEILTSHMSRLFVATGIWYVITSLFVYIESRTGTCDHVDYRGATRYVCLKQGYKWEEGIDFSGHTFMLLYAILIINEEVKAYRKGAKKIDQADKNTTEVTTEGTPNPQKETLEIYKHLIRFIYIALAGLTVLWEFMLLSTALYFHHTLHKIFAACFAVLFWYLTYYVWYQPGSTSPLYPARPPN